MLDLDVREMDDISILNGAGGKNWVATFALCSTITSFSFLQSFRCYLNKIIQQVSQTLQKWQGSEVLLENI